MLTHSEMFLISIIMAALDEASKEAVIGAGLSGLEMANLAKRGLQVISLAPHVLPPLDQKWRPLSKQNWFKNGVRVITSQSVTRFRQRGKCVLGTVKNHFYHPFLCQCWTRKYSGFTWKLQSELGLRLAAYLQSTNTTKPIKKMLLLLGMHRRQQPRYFHLSHFHLSSRAWSGGRHCRNGRTNWRQYRHCLSFVPLIDLKSFDWSPANVVLNEINFHLQRPFMAQWERPRWLISGCYDLEALLTQPLEKIYGAKVGKKGVDGKSYPGNYYPKITVFDLQIGIHLWQHHLAPLKDPVSMLGYALYQLKKETNWLRAEIPRCTDKWRIQSEWPPSIPSTSLNELRTLADELDKNKPIVGYHSGLQPTISQSVILKQAGFICPKPWRRLFARLIADPGG